MMARKIIPYRPVLKGIARSLRNNSTPGEILLWRKLRNKQLLGYDFHRQKPLDQFIVDFFCNELNLAIEIDGAYHESDETQEKDTARQERLESLGIKFLRFKETDVRTDVISVVATIEQWIKTNTR